MALHRSELGFLLALALFGLANLPLRPDRFPVSTFPMFSDRTVQMSWLMVEGPDGPLSTHAFELANDYMVNPRPRYGLHTPGPNPGGRPADKADVEARVRRHLAEQGVPWVVVVQTTTRYEPDGSVFRGETARWRIEAAP